MAATLVPGDERRLPFPLPYGRITYTGSKGRALRPLSHVRTNIRRIAPLAVDAIFVYYYSKPVALVKEETPCIRTFLRI